MLRSLKSPRLACLVMARVRGGVVAGSRLSAPHSGQLPRRQVSPNCGEVVAGCQEQEPRNRLRREPGRSAVEGSGSSGWGRKRVEFRPRSSWTAARWVTGASASVWGALKCHESLTRNQTALVYIPIRNHIAPSKIKLQPFPN